MGATGSPSDSFVPILAYFVLNCSVLLLLLLLLLMMMMMMMMMVMGLEKRADSFDTNICKQTVLRIVHVQHALMFTVPVRLWDRWLL